MAYSTGPVVRFIHSSHLGEIDSCGTHIHHVSLILNYMPRIRWEIPIHGFGLPYARIWRQCSTARQLISNRSSHYCATALIFLHTGRRLREGKWLSLPYCSSVWSCATCPTILDAFLSIKVSAGLAFWHRTPMCFLIPSLHFMQASLHDTPSFCHACRIAQMRSVSTACPVVWLAIPASAILEAGMRRAGLVARPWRLLRHTCIIKGLSSTLIQTLRARGQT